MFVERGQPRPSAQQREVLQRLPGALAAYLAAPNDASTAQGAVDLLRSGAWPAPLTAGEAALLGEGLCLVTVSHDRASAPARQTEARTEDVSLAFPEDLDGRKEPLDHRSPQEAGAQEGFSQHGGHDQ